MIILDTNIISEMMRPFPNTRVISWLDQQGVTQLFITAITIAEISYGINMLPKGKRRSFLENAFNKVLKEAFMHRTLLFDDPAAHFYGKIMSERKKSGRPMSISDGQIAAIARVHEGAIATRNMHDFENCGLRLLNPFDN
jgi:predicted nucleic acid-binding protein